MRSIDVLAALMLAEDMRDIAIENIELVGNTGEGVIRVRTIAFEKCVAVCFTLDKWQTTSEVTARYKESLPKWHHEPLDLHNQLADVVSRAEKSLYLAVRYSVSGCETWDNNSSRNYHVQVVREKAPKANKEPRRYR
jgi:hypothetical protein